MKRVTLLRHAKSSWKHPELADFDRPLNKRGQKAAPLMGARIAQRYPEGNFEILSSPAVRARATAEIVATCCDMEPGAIVFDRRLYLAEPEEIMSVLQSREDECDHVILVGHNPGLTEFVAASCGRMIDNLPTAGVAEIDFPVDRWSELARHTGRLGWLDWPKRRGDGSQ